MKYVIGLTGLIGSGKSSATKCFLELGIDVVDTDIIAHQITSCSGLAIDKIAEQFGNKYIAEDGSLDRIAMHNLIFSHQKSRLLLESILHPIIFKESIRQIELSNSLYVIIAVPLLFRSLKYMSLIRRSIFIDCDKSILVKRVMRRSNLTNTQVNTILQAQVPYLKQLQLCDDILNNNGLVIDLCSKVRELDLKYRAFLL